MIGSLALLIALAVASVAHAETPQLTAPEPLHPGDTFIVTSRKAVEKIDLATKADVDALNRRLGQLESGVQALCEAPQTSRAGSSGRCAPSDTIKKADMEFRNNTRHEIIVKDCSGARSFEIHIAANSGFKNNGLSFGGAVCLEIKEPK